MKIVRISKEREHIINKSKLMKSEIKVKDSQQVQAQNDSFVLTTTTVLCQGLAP